MRSVRQGWKVAAAFALVSAIVGMSSRPASAGWRRGRTVIVENRAYYVPAPAVTVYGAPTSTIVGMPVETIYTAPVITPAPVRASYTAPAVVVDPVVPATYFVPARVVRPRRVYYAYPY